MISRLVGLGLGLGLFQMTTMIVMLIIMTILCRLKMQSEVRWHGGYHVQPGRRSKSSAKYPSSQRCSSDVATVGSNHTFVFYRILGNDLPPRHRPDQTILNVKFILQNEPDYPNMEKRWVLNRIINSTARAELMALLDEKGQVSLKMDRMYTI